MKVCIIGASGSLGRALAFTEGQQKSDLVLVASDLRDLEALKADLKLRFGIQVEILALDLSKPNAILEVPRNGDRYYFPVGATVDHDQWGLPADEIFKVFQINFIGVSELISTLVTTPREKPLDLIGFGSIAETRGRSNNVFYSAAKRSLTSLFESLLHSSQKNNLRPYLFQVGYMKSQLSFGKKMLLPAAEPEDVAETVQGFLTSKKPGIYYLPGFWRYICGALRLVPWALYRKLQF